MRSSIWTRNIALFLSSQTISIFGSSLVQYAIIWYITLKTKSGIMVTIATVCVFLPQMLISLFAGVWADRYNRKRLIMFADLLILITTFGLAILFLMGFDDIWLLFLISFIRSLGAGIQNPASGAMITELVPKDKLLRINGINGTCQSIVQLISPMVSGALLTLLNLTTIFFIDVLIIMIGLVVLLFVKIQKEPNELKNNMTSIIMDLKEGLKYASQHLFLKRILIFYMIFMVLITPAALLTPLQVARSFGDQVWRITLIETSFAAGAIIGGIVISVWGGFRNRMHTIASACVLFGVSAFLLGVINNFTVYCSIIIIMGIGLPFFNTPSVTLVQQGVDEEKIGRVFSMFTTISTSALPLGMLIFGPLADHIKVEWLLVITGSGILVLGIQMLLDKVLVANGTPLEEMRVENDAV